MQQAVVFEASFGQQALEILHREGTIDLVITDHAIPQMTGLQLIQNIKAEWPALLVILATGYVELPPDADPYLPKLAKPFLQHDLSQAVNGAVRSGRSATRVLQFRQLGAAVEFLSRTSVHPVHRARLLVL